MIEEKTRTEKATAPSKRWLNWWFVPISAIKSVSGSDVKGPVVDADDKEFPDSDTAETFAKETLARWQMMPEVWRPTFLGAYPEGERP